MAVHTREGICLSVWSPQLCRASTPDPDIVPKDYFLPVGPDLPEGVAWFLSYQTARTLLRPDSGVNG